MPTTAQLKTIALTLAALAVIYRVDAAKTILTGDSKLFGIF